MTMTCTNCGRQFDSDQGYSGTVAHPFCLLPLCLSTYLAPAGQMRSLFENAFTGYDPPDKK